METLWLLLLFPIAWPFIAKKIWHRDISWIEMGLNIVIICLLSAGVYQLGKYGQTIDSEIWNGYVTKKEVVDGYYQTSYCCGYDDKGNCTSTCYDDHYTRSYDGYTTVGGFVFDSIDTGWRSRRDSFPPPESYKRCKIGEPASREHSYTNYVQAVPQSLFHDDSSLAQQFLGKIPSYPRVHSFYKINRVLSVDSKIPGTDIKTINNDLNEALKTLGALKQVNVVVILTEIDDPTYRFAVENAWLGGEKNDVVIFVGLDDKMITWVDIMTWARNSGNELFQVTLRDGILGMKTFDPNTFSPLVAKTITKLYDRPHMTDYEYLADEIDPPTWVFIFAWIISIIGSIGLSYIFRQTDM